MCIRARGCAWVKGVVRVDDLTLVGMLGALTMALPSIVLAFLGRQRLPLQDNVWLFDRHHHQIANAHWVRPNRARHRSPASERHGHLGELQRRAFLHRRDVRS